MLPFSNVKNLNNVFNEPTYNGIDFRVEVENIFLNHLEENKNRARIAHLNTQSLLPSFVKFGSMLMAYKFDILDLTKTWKCDNERALYYTQIPGCNLDINIRNTGQRGGAVGFYIKDKITYKRRQDIINAELQNAYE